MAGRIFYLSPGFLNLNFQIIEGFLKQIFQIDFFKLKGFDSRLGKFQKMGDQLIHPAGGADNF